ncbi:MAG: endo-1,3-alpha-glucanase family glycosylhydrolase [Capsulimonadaceae bacterium]|nr:endo-1,3-alpha-glucanase family glycosylhydrolase [Capsulimonadaceae bacterium]
MNPIVLLCALTMIALTVQPSATAAPRLVFAHYVLWNADYGKSIDGDPVKGYMRDIREAQAAGIDGFALDLGAWSAQPYYQPNMDNMFEAAARLNTDFKLFYSADYGPTYLTAADIREIMRRYLYNPRLSPFYFRYNGRPVLSTYGGELQGGGGTGAAAWWKNEVLAPLRAGTEPGDPPATGLAPIDPFFVPLFFVRGVPRPEMPVYEDVLNKPGCSYNAWWSYVVDGLFNWAIAGLPVAPCVEPNGVNLSTITTSQAYARVAHEHGKLSMGLCAPQFWWNSGKAIGRRYYEYCGGAGIRNKWMSIIDVEKPEWVELVTWNDFHEATHWSPIDDPAKYGGVHESAGFVKTHAGAYELLKYYIEWYKSGKRPAIKRDAIYWFYRTHPMDAVAPNDPLGPVTARYGPVADKIYVTCNLTAPATLIVTTGGQERRVDVPAGSADIDVPFTPGAQSFELTRNGQSVLKGTGEPIVQQIERYDFIYTTGFARASD